MKLKQYFLVFISFIALSYVYLNGNGITIERLINSIPLIEIVVIVLVAIYTTYIHIILHEFGHFLFGKLTGYQLIYFQISNIRYDAVKIKMKQMSAKGPGLTGKCVMKAPLKKDNLNKPYFLYLAGGLIINLITASIFYIGSFILQGVWGFSAFVLSLPPFLLFVWNLLPVNFTDGHLIKEIKGSDLAKSLYFKQLDLVALLESGTEYQDLPGYYFEEVENNTYSKSSLGEYLFLVACQRQLALLNFELADQLMEGYRLHWNYLKSPYAHVLASQSLFLHTLFGRHQQAKDLLERINQQSTLRTHYEKSLGIQAAYSFFTEIDIEKTKSLLEKQGSTYQVDLNQAELALQKKLNAWLREYLFT